MSNDSPVVIIHLSDLHFGWEGNERGHAERDLALKGLLRLVSKIEPEWMPKVVCITGDVGWKGQASDYTEAEKWVCELLDLLGLSPEALFICPGNHDSNRSIAKLNKRPSSSAEADKRLDLPIPESLEQPFQAYADFSRGTNVPSYTLDDKESFLMGQRFYRGINFVSYNSAWYSQGKTDKGRLWIGLNLIKSLEKKGQLPHPSELGDYPVTIALIHHPREWFHQEELHVHTHRPSTFDYLVRRCDLLLTGHVHDAPRPADQFAEAAWHLSGGAAYAGASHFNSFRLIRVEADRFVYQTFEYDPRSSDDNWSRKDDAQGTLLRVRGEEYAFGSLLVPEVLEYLDELAGRMAELPTYYPDHLRTDEAGKSRFDNIRQMVQVVEDRTAFEAEERERMTAAGQGFDRTAYKPMRARPEFQELDHMRRLPAPRPPMVWNERAGERFKRAIILGDPGFGKTWLLHYEARRLASEAARQLREQTIGLDKLILPIFARLWEVNRKDSPFEDELVEFVVGNRSNAFRRFVQGKLKSEHCVIMLDAWDEVSVEVPKGGQPLGYEQGSRQLLGERIETFADQFPQARLLLTSRIVGYDSAHLSVPNLQELELLAFDSPQAESFISIWFGDDTQAAKQCLAMLRQSPQLSGLARIPLMLTLLCRTYLERQEKQCDFPTHRVELYDRCLRGLLRDWKEEKEQREISDAYVDAVIELLRIVSYRLFVEGYEQFSESDLRKQIVPWLDRLKSSHELCGRNATSLIAELKRDGVLITAGEHRGAPLLFLHRTFQEYLTAHTLAQLVDEQQKGWQARIEICGKKMTIHQLVDRKAWDPRWQEVIVLLSGRLQDPAPLLKLLADQERDDLYRYQLALAVMCLPEIKPLRRTWRLSRLIDKITTDTFRLWWNHNTPHLTKNATPIPALLYHALPVLGQVNGRVNGQPLLELICRYLRSDDKDEQAAAVETISRIGGVAVIADPVFLDRLAQMLQTEGKWMAMHAITSLGSIAATPPILSPLVQMLQDPERDELVSMMVGNTLANLVINVDSGVVAAALDRLAHVIQDPDSSVWSVIISHVCRILGVDESLRWEENRRLGKDRPVAELQLAQLMEDLLKGLEQGARYEETEAGEDSIPTVLFNNAIEITLDELAEMLRGSDWRLRSQAISAVCKSGGAAASKAILDRLVQILQDPDSGSAVTPAILDHLARKLEDPYWGTDVLTIPSHLPQALSNLVPLFKAWSVGVLAASVTDKAATTPFLDLNYLAQKLRRPSFADEVGQAIFEQLCVLYRYPPWLERAAAVAAISILRDAMWENPIILDQLSQMLQDRRYEVWSAGVMAIRGIGSAAAQAGILIQMAQMLECEDWLKRYAAVIMIMGIGDALADMPVILEGVLDRLAQMLTHPNWLERYAALTALASIRSATPRPEIISRLVKMLRDPMPMMRSTAAVALGKMNQPGVYFFVTRDEVKIKGVAELAAA